MPSKTYRAHRAQAAKQSHLPGEIYKGGKGGAVAAQSIKNTHMIKGMRT